MAQTLELIDGLPANVGIMLDTYHMNIEEADPYAAVAVAGPHIKHVQVSGTDRGAPGADHFDWPRFLAALARDRLPRRRLHRVVHRARTRPSPPPRRSGVRSPRPRTGSPWTAWPTCGG